MNQFTAPLWGDEAFSTLLAMKSPLEIIAIVASDTSPPLHPLLLHYWMLVFGNSEPVIRALSFSFYLLTAVTVYLIGKSLWNKKTGILAGLLVMVNPFLFAYAFEGRMYSLLLFTSTLSMYCFLTHRRRLYILAAATALYTHHFSILVIGIQVLWAIGRSLKKGPGKIANKLWYHLFPMIAAFLLYLPWLPILYRQTKMVTGGFWLKTPAASDLIGLYLAFLVGSQKGNLTLLAAGLIALILAWRRWQFKQGKDWFLLGWFFLPILLIWIFSQFAQSIFFDRYLLAMIPAALLILASRSRGFKSIVPLAALILILGWFCGHYFTHPTRRPFRQLADYVKKTKQPEDRLVNWNSTAHHLWEMKYYQIPAPIYAGGETKLPFFVGTAQMTPADIIGQLPDSPRIGVVYSGHPDNVNIPNYTITEQKKFADLTFQWWQKE